MIKSLVVVEVRGNSRDWGCEDNTYLGGRVFMHVAVDESLW